MLRPAIVCSTFGVSDRIRVPGPAARTRTAVSPRNDINSPQPFARTGGTSRLRGSVFVRRHTVKRVISCTLAAKSHAAPSPGLEPELSEPKSDVLPITPRRISHQETLDGTVALRRTDTLIDVAVLDKEPDKEARAPRARMTGSDRR